MCGISGVYQRSGESVDRALLQRMNSLLIHRGPDAEGTWVHQNIGLAHRRLRIIDLSAEADQPMLSPCRKVAITFNGEIYNFQALRVELQQLGHEFKTRSDTEVLLHAFLEWGESCFARLNGIFALAIVDARKANSQLYLARDRFGAKPLFVVERDLRIGFASELKPLLSLPWVSAELSNSALFYFLKFSHVPKSESIVTDVEQLEPGHFLIWNEKGRIVKRFHNVLDSEGSTLDTSDSLDSIFKDVVSRQAIADVPIGCFLSGGVDSTLLLKYLSVNSPQRAIQSFCVSFKDSEFDEGSVASLVARTFGADHHELKIDDSDLLESAIRVPYSIDQPLGDPSLLPTEWMCREASKSIKVGYSGDGGDELFCGYPQHYVLKHLEFLQYLPSDLRVRFFESIEKLIGFCRGAMTDRWTQQLSKTVQIMQFKDPEELFQYIIGCLGPIKLSKMNELMSRPVDLDISYYDRYFGDWPDVDWSEKIRKIFLNTFLTDTVLAKSDRSGMLNGLEVRVPLLDDRVVSYASRISAKDLIRIRNSKKPLRDLLKRGLPQSIWARGKQSFNIPLNRLMKTTFKPLIDDYLGESRLRNHPHLNAKKVLEIKREFEGNYYNHSHLLWSLYVFERWREGLKS